MRVRPLAFAFVFAFTFTTARAAPKKPAPMAKPAPAPDPLDGCKREPHGTLTVLTCGEYFVMDGLMPGALSPKTTDSALRQFAVGFPADARRDQLMFEAGGKRFPSLRVSGDRGPKGPFQAQLVLAPAGAETRVLSCAGPHPGGGPDRCREILAILIATPR